MDTMIVGKPQEKRTDHRVIPEHLLGVPIKELRVSQYSEARGSYLLGSTQLALQVFDLFLGLPNAPQGVLISNFLALSSVPLLQFPNAAS